MATAAMPRGGADARPVPAAPAAVPAAPAAVPAARDAVPATPARPRLTGSLTRAQQITAGVIVAAALVLSGIGLYLSFEHVAAYAHEELGFQSLDKARLFTVGVDVGILVLIALDLLMAWLRRPIGWVRYPVWFLTGATVVLNAASAAPENGVWTLTDRVAVFAHAVVPLLFITVVEVGKTAIDRVVRPKAGADRPGVPLSRWALDPARTFAMWRRMKLWGIDSYPEAVTREQALRVYRVMLDRQYGSHRKAPKDALLPLTMARYGLTVDEALALPQEAEEREQQRQAAKKDAAAALIAQEAERQAQAEIVRLRAAGAVQAARHEVDASTEQAAVTARAELVAAERAAEAEADALTSATAAEAEARKAAAAKSAAEDRKRAAEAEEDAAETEARAAETRRIAAEDQALAAEAETRIATARRLVAEEEERAAEAAERAAGTRLRAAGIEQRAVEAEDEARLSPKDRAVLRLARMALLEHAGDVDAIPLETVATAFDVSTTTASNYRKWAAQKISEGYRPDGT
ncbi:DUF2637 domain-containing protein [Streptomyces zhihengii]|uniref:DUF2637 domain-containing protein n=1 Tax=Streptomyces zhihengii TaxID=1818004 RepID=UPI0034569DF7